MASAKKESAGNDQVKQLLVSKFEIQAKYKDLSAELRKTQAEIARLNAKLVKAGYDLTALGDVVVLW